MLRRKWEGDRSLSDGPDDMINAREYLDGCRAVLGKFAAWSLPLTEFKMTDSLMRYFLLDSWGWYTQPNYKGNVPKRIALLDHFLLQQILPVPWNTECSCGCFIGVNFVTTQKTVLTIKSDARNLRGFRSTCLLTSVKVVQSGMHAAQWIWWPIVETALKVDCNSVHVRGWFGLLFCIPPIYWCS